MRADLPVLPGLVASLAAILIISSCTPAPFAPPAQIAMPSGPEPPPTPDPTAGLIVAMADPDADAHILGDVFPADAGSEWRFTGLHPKFRLTFEHTKPLYFYLRISAIDEMIRDRGPVTISIAINGRPFQAPRFTSVGEREYRWPVPDDWVPLRGTVEIALDISPPWHGPNSSLVGTFLNTVGFEER